VEITEFIPKLGELSKATQITSIRETHFPHYHLNQFSFFDDDLLNTAAVRTTLPDVTVRHVDNLIGLTVEAVDTAF